MTHFYFRIEVINTVCLMTAFRIIASSALDLRRNSRKQSAIKITMHQIVFRYSRAPAWALKKKARINFEKFKSFRLFRLGKRPGLFDEEYIKCSRCFGLGFIDITS